MRRRKFEFFVDREVSVLSRGSTWPICPPIVNDRDKFSNRKQSETNRNDEIAMCDYLSG